MAGRSEKSSAVCTSDESNKQEKTAEIVLEFLLRWF